MKTQLSGDEGRVRESASALRKSSDERHFARLGPGRHRTGGRRRGVSEEIDGFFYTKL
jgi:hypothetical protein